jgi:hypothetical protein
MQHLSQIEHSIVYWKKKTKIKNKKLKSDEVERQLGIMLKPQPDIQNFSRVLFTAQSIVLVGTVYSAQANFHDL